MNLTQGATLVVFFVTNRVPVSFLDQRRPVIGSQVDCHRHLPLVVSGVATRNSQVFPEKFLAFLVDHIYVVGTVFEVFDLASDLVADSPALQVLLNLFGLDVELPSLGELGFEIDHLVH